MTTWAVVNGGELAYLVAALVVSIAIGVSVLVAIAAAEARSRRGEAERVAAIRQRLLGERLLRERQPVGHSVRGRS